MPEYVKATIPFDVFVQHDRIDTTSYAIQVDGVDTATKTLAAANTEQPDPALPFSVRVPDGLGMGAYEVTAVAINEVDLSVSDPASLIVRIKPAKSIITSIELVVTP